MSRPLTLCLAAAIAATFCPCLHADGPTTQPNAGNGFVITHSRTATAGPGNTITVHTTYTITANGNRKVRFVPQPPANNPAATQPDGSAPTTQPTADSPATQPAVVIKTPTVLLHVAPATQPAAHGD